MKKIFLIAGIILLTDICTKAIAQSVAEADTLSGNVSLASCIHYALQHQPALQQSYLDQQITEREIKSKLADWYPQIGINYDYEYYLQLPTSFFPNSATGIKEPIKTGVANNSTLGLEVNQTIFSNDLLLASHSAKDVRRQASQNVTNIKINAIVNVTKAYYEVLISLRQLDILKQDIVRLQKSLQDAYSQYQSGVVDKTDYEQATISLNNSLADLKSTQEQIKGNYAYLKQLMGYPSEASLELSDDTTEMENQVQLDTTQLVDYNNRIEYQLLQTQKQLQLDNLHYYKLNFLPSLSAFYDYNLAYLNDHFSNVYNTSFPNSIIGVQLTMPIFQGTMRIQNIKEAQLEVKRADWDITAIKYQINTEFVQAMAAYKSNMNDWQMLKKNMELAQDVYNIISLQYKAGVKTYLDVITAESDLRTSEFSYLNALLNVLSSKIDVEKAMGTIPLNQ
jgi:outer membrane protein